MAYYLYADGTELFQEFSLSDSTLPDITIKKMDLWVASIHQWDKTNMLKRNDNKTEIIIIQPISAHQHLPPEDVKIGYVHMTPNTTPETWR